MDTVMVLSVLNGGLPISPVVENGTDMRRNGTSNDKSEIARGLPILKSILWKFGERASPF